MKIMLVSRVVPAHRPGGMPHVVMDRAEALARAGHDVHVVTTDLPDQKKTHIGENGLVMHFTPSPTQKWSREFSENCKSLSCNLLPDIIHLDSFDAANLWWTDSASRVAITMHGFGFGAFLTQWNTYMRNAGPAPRFDSTKMMTEAKALSYATVVLGVSKWEWRMLRDQYGLRQARLVYNPIASYFFKEEQQYGPGIMDRQANAQREYFLCVAISQGDTRGFDVCHKAAKLAGVELRVAEKWDRRSMPAIYDGAKALLLPTAFAQGYDLSVAEARSRCCPAILSSTGSYLDEARPWDTFTEIGDVESLSVILKNWKQPQVDATAADEHRPEQHAKNWIEAVMG